MWILTIGGFSTNIHNITGFEKMLADMIRRIITDIYDQSDISTIMDIIIL